MAHPHYLIRDANVSDLNYILDLGAKIYKGDRFYADLDEREVRYHLEQHPSLCHMAVDTRGVPLAFGLAKNFHPVFRDQGQLSWFASSPTAGGSGLQLTRSIRGVLKSEFSIERAILDVNVKNQIVLNRVLRTPGAEVIATYQMISVPC
jgi:hypothetical protein